MPALPLSVHQSHLFVSPSLPGVLSGHLTRSLRLSTLRPDTTGTPLLPPAQPPPLRWPAAPTGHSCVHLCAPVGKKKKEFKKILLPFILLLSPSLPTSRSHLRGRMLAACHQPQTQFQSDRPEWAAWPLAPPAWLRSLAGGALDRQQAHRHVNSLCGVPGSGASRRARPAARGLQGAVGRLLDLLHALRYPRRCHY